MGLNINGQQQSAYDVHLQAKQGVGTVSAVKTQTASDGSKKDVVVKKQTEVVHPGVASNTKLCTVSVGGGRTVNLGDYNSAKIDVFLSMPCEKDALEDTYQFCMEWVGKKLEEATEDAGK